MVTGTAVAGIALVALGPALGPALGLGLTPGPTMGHLVSRSVTQGRRAGLLPLLGVAAGSPVYRTAVR